MSYTKGATRTTVRGLTRHIRKTADSVDGAATVLVLRHTDDDTPGARNAYTRALSELGRIRELANETEWTIRQMARDRGVD